MKTRRTDLGRQSRDRRPLESTSEIVDSAVDERISWYKVRVKYFFWGVGFLAATVTAVDIVSEREIIREAHKLAFPAEPFLRSPTAYSSTMVLKAADRTRRGDMLVFYAEEGQGVKAYVDAIYRFVGGGQPLPIVVAIDDSVSGQPTTHFDRHFHDISKFLSFGRRGNDNLIAWQGAPNVHHIGFSIASVPNEDELHIEITITCIVHVYERK